MTFEQGSEWNEGESHVNISEKRTPGRSIDWEIILQDISTCLAMTLFETTFKDICRANSLGS